MHAVLGTSDHCIASYPGDFAQALIALDAQVETAGPGGGRIIPLAKLHRPPGERPDIETLYLKVRDRESYEFALASAAVVLDLQDGIVRDARIALGGVATVPWRATQAEDALKGRRFDEAAANAAAEAAFAGAKAGEHNAFKITLGKRTLVRALQQTAKMELPT
jgi:xanthine dehydrogenase YagS FAD-binding subunit